MIRERHPGLRRACRTARGAPPQGAPARGSSSSAPGTGETAARLLAAHPEARLTGVDTSRGDARRGPRGGCPPGRAELRVGRLEDPLPEGPFDLVASALCVHHLDAAGKRDLFARIARRARPGGRFVLGDVVVPEDPAEAVTSLTPGYDLPSTLDEQLRLAARGGVLAGDGRRGPSGDLAVRRRPSQRDAGVRWRRGGEIRLVHRLASAT